MKKFFILVILSFQLYFFSFANNIDTLRIQLKNAKSDTAKIEIYRQLAKYYHHRSPKTTIKYADTIKHFSVHRDYKQGMAIAANCYGLAYWKLGEFNKALDYFAEALLLNRQLKNKNGIAAAYGNIGIIYYQKNDFDQTLEFFLKAFEITSELKDTVGIVRSYQNIGTIYRKMRNYDKALECYLNVIYLFEKSPQLKVVENILYSTHNNIGVVYEDLNDYDKALHHYKISAQGKKKHEQTNGWANTQLNIGNILLIKKQHNEAMKHFKEALKVFEALGDKSGCAAVNLRIGANLLETKRYDESLNYLKIAEKLAFEIESMNELHEVYLYLSKAYAYVNNYEEAYRYQEKYSQLNDTIFNEITARNIAEMTAKYDVRKKEKEITALIEKQKLNSLQKSKQTRRLIIVFVIIAFIVFISIYILKQRFRKKRNESAGNQLEQKLDEIKQVHHKKPIEEKEPKNTVVLKSETGKDEIEITPSEILFLMSSHNYVEVHWQHDEKPNKQLIRNNLKTFEKLLEPFPSIFRCHRSYIVNINKVQKVKGNAQGYKLYIENQTEPVPVSRSYLKKLNEILQQNPAIVT